MSALVLQRPYQDVAAADDWKAFRQHVFPVIPIICSPPRCQTGVSLKIQRQLYGRVARRANERVSDGLCLKHSLETGFFSNALQRLSHKDLGPPPATVAPAGSGGLYGHLTKICCDRVIKMANSSCKTFGGPLSCLSSKSLRNIFVRSFRMGGQRYFRP